MFLRTIRCLRTVSRNVPIFQPATHRLYSPTSISARLATQYSLSYGQKDIQDHFEIGHISEVPTVSVQIFFLRRFRFRVLTSFPSDDIEKAGNFKADPNLTAGNEKRRWHGTRKDCNLGDPSSTQGTTLCNAPSCSLCNIIRESFNISQWGKNTGWGRCVNIQTEGDGAESF